MSVFDSSDYQHGCRCACCSSLFEDGDEVHDRHVDEWAGIGVVMPTCLACAASSAPLGLREGGRVTLLADGLVQTLPRGQS